MVPTFWVNSHFGPQIDFVANSIPKKGKSFLKSFLSSTNQRKHPICLTECPTCEHSPDVAIKILLKKDYLSFLNATSAFKLIKKAKSEYLK